MAVRALRSLSFVVFCSLLSGCFGEAQPSGRFDLEADGGVRFSGWDYEGLSRTPVSARLVASLHDAQDMAEVELTGTWRSDDTASDRLPFRIAFTPNGTGAVRSDTTEAVWPGSLPVVPIRFLAEGTAVLKVGNATVNDTYAGSEAWAARLVVLDGGIRDVVKGHVLKADRSGPFDPLSAEDASVGDDSEAMFILSSLRAEDVQAFSDLVAAHVGERATHATPFEVVVPGSVVRIVVDLSAAVPATGPFSISVFDGAGNEVARQAKGAVQRSHVATFDIPAQVVGNWSVRVSSATLGADYTVALDVVPPPRPAWWLHWEGFKLTGRSASAS